MPQLQKAQLQKVKADENETTIGQPVKVQFNPTSLKLKLANQVDGGRSNARQRRQQTGASSNVLSMDLIFDSADEGTTGSPVSVRTKTAIVEEFVVPRKNNPDPPPRLRFEWNELVLTGIVESVDIDFDLFAADGTPLRAKVSLSIKEQKPEYQFLEGGAGSNTSNNATDPGGNGSQPGSGTNDPDGDGGGDRSAPALDGESAAEFAARVGLDPTAWRGLSVDLSAGLSLEAGVEVGFSLGLSAGAGIGISAGVQASVGVSLEASVGLEAGLSASAGVSGDAAGLAMASAGGVEATVGAVAIAQSTQAVSATVQAFGIDRPVSTIAGVDAATSVAATAIVASRAPASASAVVAARTIVRTPLTRTGKPTHTEQTLAAAATPPPQPDPRAISYGYGVPLQPLTQTALDPQQTTACSGHAGVSIIEPPFRTDPTVAPWTALPRNDSDRNRTDALEQDKRANPCRLVNNWCECDH